MESEVPDGARIDRRGGKGLNRRLIAAAVDYARKQGAKIIEAYPVDTAFSRNTSTEAFTGFARTFASLGFQEVIRRSGKRPILRYVVAS